MDCTPHWNPQLKTIQITIDEDLLERLDRRLCGRSKARSAFVRAAIERELRRAEVAEMEEQWRASYENEPVDLAELEAWELVQDWTDDRAVVAHR